MNYLSLLMSQRRRVIKALKAAGFTRIPPFKLVMESLKTKEGEDYLGLFTRGTQFTDSLVLRINVKFICTKYKDLNLVKDDVAMTIAHELGHSIVEVMETYEGTPVFGDFNWRKDFTEDEEEFVELFAAWLLAGSILEAPYFSELIPAVAKGYVTALS